MRGRRSRVNCRLEVRMQQVHGNAYRPGPKCLSSCKACKTGVSQTCSMYAASTNGKHDDTAVWQTARTRHVRTATATNGSAVCDNARAAMGVVLASGHLEKVAPPKAERLLGLCSLRANQADGPTLAHTVAKMEPSTGKAKPGRTRAACIGCRSNKSVSPTQAQPRTEHATRDALAHTPTCTGNGVTELKDIPVDAVSCMGSVSATASTGGHSRALGLTNSACYCSVRVRGRRTAQVGRTDRCA